MTDAARRADCDVHASGDYRGAYYCETHRVRYHDTIHACLCPAGKSAALADENSRLAAELADEKARHATTYEALGTYQRYHAENLDKVERFAAELEAVQRWTSADKPLPEDDAIRAAFPTRSGKHATYAEAMRMVSAKSSKVALVALVNWLLCERDEAGAKNEQLKKRAQRGRMLVDGARESEHQARAESARLAARVAALTEALERIARGDLECGHCTRGGPMPDDVAKAALASEGKP